MSLKNIFKYGEVGTAVDGFRESEISQQSANSIENFILTEMGTLKVAKQYEKIRIVDDNEPIQKHMDTKYHFFIVVTGNHIYTIDKNSLVKISSLAHGLPINHESNGSVFNDFLFLKGNNNTYNVFAFNASGAIGTTNFNDTIELPFLKLTRMDVDYYKVFNPTIGTETKLSPELMRSFGGDLEVYVKDGKLLIANLDVPIDRIYKAFKAGLSKDDMTSPADKHNYLIFRNYKTPVGNEFYYAGNTKLEFTGPVDDPIYGSVYYTTASPEGARGVLRFGEMEDFRKDVVDFIEYQSRLVIATREKMYFSKTLDYNNFVPGTSTADAFFLKLSPIDGNQPSIMKLSSGNGIYVTSEKGVMVVGYNTSLSPSTSMGSVYIAGNSEPTKASAVIENSFYYIDKKGLLRCILTAPVNGVIAFSNEVAEKYKNDRNLFKWVTRGYVNEANTCVCTGAKDSNLYIYERIGDGIFRHVRLNFDNEYPVFGYNGNFVSGTSMYRLTDKNYKRAKLVNNMPDVKTPTRGHFLMDFEMDYHRIVLNVLSPTGSMRGVRLNGNPFQNLQRQVKDYNIYDYNGSLNVTNLTIEMETNETEQPVEIKGINYALRGGGL
ncbi:MAG: hypothetical protein ACRC0F_08040 [Cetobacterium sp.]